MECNQRPSIKNGNFPEQIETSAKTKRKRKKHKKVAANVSQTPGLNNGAACSSGTEPPIMSLQIDAPQATELASHSSTSVQPAKVVSSSSSAAAAGVADNISLAAKIHEETLTVDETRNESAQVQADSANLAHEADSDSLPLEPQEVGKTVRESDRTEDDEELEEFLNNDEFLRGKGLKLRNFLPLLKKYGWIQTRCKGSHMIYTKPSDRTVSRTYNGSQPSAFGSGACFKAKETNHERS